MSTPQLTGVPFSNRPAGGKTKKKPHLLNKERLSMVLYKDLLLGIFGQAEPYRGLLASQFSVRLAIRVI
jgi:hypothetical protein